MSVANAKGVNGREDDQPDDQDMRCWSGPAEHGTSQNIADEATGADCLGEQAALGHEQQEYD